MSADGVFKMNYNKKRGRKSKAEKEREREREREREDVASSRGGRETRVGSVDEGVSMRGVGTGGAGAGAGADDGDDDDDLLDEGELLGGEEGVTDTEAEKKNLAYVLFLLLDGGVGSNEIKRIWLISTKFYRLLVDAFNPIQSERYDLFKRAKLRKESLRRIVNHALSQSVPASVVTTINGFTKVFAGEIIEKARTVQAEWADAYDQAALAAFEAEEAATAAAEAAKSTTTATQRPAGTSTATGTGVNNNNNNNANGTATTTPLSSFSGYLPPSASSTPVNTQRTYSPGANSALPTSTTTRPKREFKPPSNPHRGQLLPSHLREALRRYKRDCEGGGVGFSGLSMGNLGVRGSFTWNSGSVGGRRLFR